jgi:DNA-binding XRE family transcriptional regulator
MLAHEAGVTTSTYNRLANGSVAPGWWTVRQVARALDVRLVELARMVEAEEEG